MHSLFFPHPHHEDACEELSFSICFLKQQKVFFVSAKCFNPLWRHHVLNRPSCEPHGGQQPASVWRRRGDNSWKERVKSLEKKQTRRTEKVSYALKGALIEVRTITAETWTQTAGQSFRDSELPDTMDCGISPPTPTTWSVQTKMRKVTQGQLDQQNRRNI